MLMIIFAGASLLCFVAGMALNIYNDDEARRLTPDEAQYDVPTGGEYAWMAGFALSLLLAAIFSAIATTAKRLLPRNYSS